MIEIAKLEKMVQAEVAADKWWDGLNDKEKKAYIKAHPKSKYARSSSPAASGKEPNPKGKRGEHYTDIWSNNSPDAGMKVANHFRKLGYHTSSPEGTVFATRVFHKPAAHREVFNHYKGLNLKGVGLTGPFRPDGSNSELPGATITHNTKEAMRES